MGAITRSHNSKEQRDRTRTVFGMYELIERIAVGGMAEIYLARELEDSDSGYLVVKRILPHFAVDRELVDMFLDEQRMAATLDHENIVRTYDVGEVDGEYFISMEYLNGQDVRRIVREVKKTSDKLPLDLALTIVVGAAAGLHYAHEKRGVNLQPLDIVHRDVTPHNLIVTYDGVVKLVDFGVAKAANRQNDTQAGTIKGKIPYMSPEQCKGLDLDRRSDIYSLGIILYELTTGTRLYGATGGEFATMRRIVEEPPVPPSTRDPEYPPELERIVLKALAKDLERRYETALDLKHDIEAFARDHKIPISPERLARFMHEHFPSNILAWEEGDIDKMLESQLEERSSPTQRSQGSGDDTGSKHIGSSLTESLESVWGAADSSAKSSRRLRSQSRPAIRHATPEALPILPSALDSPPNGTPAVEPAPQLVPGAGSHRLTPARGMPGAHRLTPARGTPGSASVKIGIRPVNGMGSVSKSHSTVQLPVTGPVQRLRLPVPWWWIAVLVVGMVLAFLLGAMV